MAAVDNLQSYLLRNMNLYYTNDFRFPYVGALFILKHCIGICREETDSLLERLLGYGSL